MQSTQFHVELVADTLHLEIHCDTLHLALQQWRMYSNVLWYIVL